MRFSYQLFRGAYYPIVPVIIAKGAKKVNTSAVIDSGASVSIFNGSTGRELGLQIEDGEKHIFQGASAKLVGYMHEAVVAIAGKEITCNVAFSDELNTSFNLIGREGVFGKFTICFDEAERRVEFIPK